MLLIKAIKSAKCIKNSLGSTCTNIKMTNAYFSCFLMEIKEHVLGV